MRGPDFRAWCHILWGGQDREWAHGAARYFQVSERNVHYWAAGDKPIPPGVVSEIGREIHRRLCDSTDRTPGLEPFRAAQLIDLGTAAA